MTSQSNTFLPLLNFGHIEIECHPKTHLEKYNSGFCIQVDTVIQTGIKVFKFMIISFNFSGEEKTEEKIEVPGEDL